VAVPVFPSLALSRAGPSPSPTAARSQRAQVPPLPDQGRVVASSLHSFLESIAVGVLVGRAFVL